MDFRFRPDDLRPAARRPGIAGVLRCRNSADFVRDVVLSHLPHYDEIVAVHNRCTDATPAILADLAREHPEQVRVFAYDPPVHPQGTRGHLAEPGTSVTSVVNYTNWALARTTRRVAALLDDDHLALEGTVARITAAVRAAGRLGREMWCFSGLNLAADERGEVGVLRAVPFAGNGDHGYFEVTSRTYFEHDPRFERFRFREVRRRYHGLAYWHLKHLKRGLGFANYELDENPESRFHRRRERFERAREVLSLEHFLVGRRPGSAVARGLAALPLPERLRLRLLRHATLHEDVTAADVATLRATLARHDLTHAGVPQAAAAPRSSANGS